MEAMQKIKCLTIEDSNFPDRLRKLSGMPKKLYYIGNLPDPKKPAAAVVGARMCSPYGRCQAFKYARTMASYGVQIISGMARGIDAEGHKGALDTDTPTFAVLGSGVDVCYPNSNRRLYQRILEKGGGIISELPPGSPPVNWAFPARNRIISGLSPLTVVVQAGNRSGALITAELAADQGRDVGAVPGNIDSEYNLGSNKLLREGAFTLTGVQDLLEASGVSVLSELEAERMLSDEEKQLYFLLCSHGEMSLDQLAFYLKKPVNEVGSLAIVMEMKGIVFLLWEKFLLQKLENRL